MGLMLAQGKENGVKQAIEQLSTNFQKIEKGMVGIQNMELDKPHPDIKFNQDAQSVKNKETLSKIQGKMENIKRFYINLKKEDEEFDEVQAQVDQIQKGLSQNAASLSQISKQMVEKHNQNKQEGNVSDEDWNNQLGFVLNA